MNGERKHNDLVFFSFFLVIHRAFLFYAAYNKSLGEERGLYVCVQTVSN